MGSLHIASSQNFLFNSQDIIPAIGRLNIEYKDYVIVSFGVDIDELIIKSSNDLLKDIKIIKFKYRNNYLVGDSIFILKKTNLPKLNYKEIKVDEIQKYSLDKVIEEYNLYVTVVDLNQSADIRVTFAEASNEKDLRKSVYMAIFFNLEVQWNKNIECIQIKQASVYRERGILSNLSDVKTIDEKPSR